jgi:hypothetical protein
MSSDEKEPEAQVVPPLHPGARAILIYTMADRFSPEVEKLLIESGYIPLKCQSIDQVSILPFTVSHSVGPAQLDAITQAALKAIDTFEGGTTTVPGAFGTALARLLLKAKA